MLSRSLASRSLHAARFGPLSFHRFNSQSAMHGGDPETLEREKRRNLEKKQHLTSTPHEGAPGWNEYLASQSEAFVKADRHVADGPPSSDLAERTVKHVKERHVQSSGLGSREEAKYERDEVEGPLKTSATGKLQHEVKQTSEEDK
ncbi:hypothetical protein M422DRAFT_65004 [Sphaerobolus stellatus SS14]|nr:hypothetical protein M422DRAFT_65004 [Sphaerobolus stellatus SS14]